MASQVKDIKQIPGTQFVVDGFNFNWSPFVRHYFLTHYHSDHTIGLKKSFDRGEVTARLLIYDFGIRRDVVRPLALDVTTRIQGVEVTLICANHCPGAVCFVFKLPDSDEKGMNGKLILHTGDFRYCEEKHGQHPILLDRSVDILMLDTTYCDKKWVFPSQGDVIEAVSRFIWNKRQRNPRTLFLFMSYRIGKEKCYFGAAEKNNLKIYVSAAKRKILNLLNLPDKWMSLLTENQFEAHIHISTMMHQKYPESVQEELKCSPWTEAVLIRPTGWTFRHNVARNGDTLALEPRSICDKVSSVGVPYSEHSSFAELQACVKKIRPKKLIPTVNADSDGKARALVDKFCSFMDLSKDKSRLDSYFVTGSKRKQRAIVDEAAVKPTDENRIDIEEIDVEEQKRLWDDAQAASSKDASKKKSEKISGTTIKSFFLQK
eukprot:jgi/Picsp_1/6639/NSC_03982-R1_dna cross-link repair protein snm1